MQASKHTARRSLVFGAAAALGAAALPALPGRAWSAPAPASAAHRRPLRGGARLPVIGMGTWVTFNVGDDPALRARCTEVMRAFVDEGGGLVDSSPMYGSAEAVVGHALAVLGHPPEVFCATKVWTDSLVEGREQIEASFRLWGVSRFDLLQVHNLLGWEHQLPRLVELKAAGRIAHVGVTTSHGRRHDALEQIVATQPVDFVQLTYNLADREAERRLLPMAAERGIAVIANRPFRRGELIRRLARRPLPAWAAEAFDASSWPQCLLKWIVGHPAITCAIPATSNPGHLRENMAAGRGRLPDAAARTRLAAALREL